jgi:hypothetical protein
MSDDKPQGLTHAERQDVEELSAPRAPVIYEVVRQQGEDELCRPDGSLHAAQGRVNFATHTRARDAGGPQPM